MPNNDQPRPAGLNKTSVIAAILAAGGGLVALAVLLWALVKYAEQSSGASYATGAFPSATKFFETTALLFGGLAVGLLLWGVAEILRKLDRLFEIRRDAPAATPHEATLYGVPFHADGPAHGSDDLKLAIQELIALTREVRDISLLSEPERKARLQVQGKSLARKLAEEIPAILQEHKWVEARDRVRTARERFPTFTEWDTLEKQIEAARANVEARDVETVGRQVDDLAALKAWDRATGIVRELLERHPQSPKAHELARRVALQREKADAEQRARLMSQAQDAANRREWNQALSLANEMIRRFPRSLEAEALRQQLPTLTENAEIQMRHRMEAEFRELVKQHRTGEAIALARELIQRYPQSPQAEFFRDQLPKLEERLMAR